MNRRDLLAVMAMLIYTDRLTAPVDTPEWAVDEAEKVLAEVERRAGKIFKSDEKGETR